jgi:Ras-related protein Rab-1A
MDDQNIKL